MPILSIIIAFLLAVLSQAQFNLTLVTGMWNLGRGKFSTSERSYQNFYLMFFKELLQYKGKMIIFGSEVQQNFVNEHRPADQKSNTFFIKKSLKDFEKYWYTKKISEVIDEKLNGLSPIKKIQYRNIPQFGIKMYNPIVMSKHRLMFQAAENDPFSSEYLLWVDGGYTHLMPLDFIEKGFYQKLVSYYQPGWFLQTGDFPFGSLKVGFRDEGAEYLPKNKKKTTQILGNWLGGRKQAASTAYHTYQNFLRITFERLDMNTDEAIFIIMAERYPFLFTSVNNSKPEVYFELKVDIKKRELHDLKFIWNEQQNKEIQKLDRDRDYQPLVITKVIQWQDHSYFQSHIKICQNILRSRVKFLCLVLLVGVGVVYLIRLQIKKGQYIQL